MSMPVGREWNTGDTYKRLIQPELLSKAGSGVITAPAAGERTLAGDDLGALFGLEMDGSTATATATAAPIQPQAAAKPVRAARPTAKSKRSRDPASRLLAALRQAGSLDNAEARAATGLDAQAVRLLLKQLVADGLARVQGQKRATRYVAVGKKVKA